MASKLDVLLEIKDHIAAYTAHLGGEFDDEIARLTKIKDEAEERLKQCRALDSLEYIKKQTEQWCEARKQEAEDAFDKLAGFKASLAEEQAELLANKQALVLEKQQHQDRVNQFDLTIQSKLDAAEADRANAAQTLQAAAQKAVEVDTKEAEVADREAEVQRKLDVLKSI